MPCLSMQLTVLKQIDDCQTFLDVIFEISVWICWFHLKLSWARYDILLFLRTCYAIFDKSKFTTFNKLKIKNKPFFILHSKSIICDKLYIVLIY